MPRTLAELVVKSLENHWFVEADSRKPYKIKEIFELCGNLHADIQYYNGERRIIRINNHYRDEPI
ncbi:hypothetical protein JXA48_05290 [Candidatus Woesearchaeota archaeon]|nr:hypothetical protein [Candidatus Woesearchaeota archaeon]